MYSASAISQLAKIARSSGCRLSFKWPYHAIVMKVLAMGSKATNLNVVDMRIPFPDRIARPDSLPLDRAGRLARDVVHDAVDALDGVDDPRRSAGEDVVRHAGPVGRHEVVGLDGS